MSRGASGGFLRQFAPLTPHPTPIPQLSVQHMQIYKHPFPPALLLLLVVVVVCEPRRLEQDGGSLYELKEHSRLSPRPKHARSLHQSDYRQLASPAVCRDKSSQCTHIRVSMRRMPRCDTLHSVLVT